MPASRFDFGSPVTSTITTPAGGRRLSGRFTRIGVATYQRGDGTSVREHRPREEVFAEDSLASLRGAPVTDLHPPGEEMVNPTNWATLAKGHALDGKPLDPFIEGQVDVNDQGLIAKIDAGEAKEISMGYTCDVDATPGVFEGQPYDQVQRNIRYNHVALGPEGWGRMGPRVSLRVDSSSAILLHEHPKGDTVHVMANTAKHRVDGIEYDAGSDAHIAAVEKFAAKLAGDLATANATATTEKKRADAAEAASTPAALHKRADARARLLTFARRADMLGPDYLRKDEEGSAVDDDSIIRAILKKQGIAGVENMSHEMLMGALVAAMGMAPAAPAAPATPPLEGEEMAGTNDAARTDAEATRGKLRAAPRTDEDDDPVTKAEKAARDKRANAWRVPAKA